MDVHARDPELAWGRTRTLPFVDAEGLAVAGRSLGRKSDEFFTSRNAYVDAVMTFCGAMTRPENHGGGDP